MDDRIVVYTLKRVACSINRYLMARGKFTGRAGMVAMVVCEQQRVDVIQRVTITPQRALHRANANTRINQERRATVAQQIAVATAATAQ